MSKPRWRFVGRQWAVTRTAEWYLSDEPALVVTGNPGSGKTTLVTSMATMPQPLGGAVRAIHRCRSHVLTSTDPMRILARIAGQLAHHDREYRDTLARLNWAEHTRASDTAGFARSIVLGSMSPAVAYERVLRHPFTSMASARARTADTVVVIDGLDEAHPMLAYTLSRSLLNPVPGLRMLLSARTTTTVFEHLRHLPRLDLTADCPAGIDDLGAYLATLPWLSSADRASVADLAGTSYPYAQLAAQLIRSGGVEGVESPSGLIDAVVGSVRDPDGRAAQILSVLARSRDSGLSAGQLAWIVGLHPAAVTRYLDRLRHLLTPGPELRLSHRCLAEHVNVGVRDGGATDWMIAGALWRRWQTHGASAGRYVLRYLLPHLVDAVANRNRYAAEAALRSTLSNVDYLATLIDTIGVDDVVSTLADAVDRLPDPPVELSDLSTICRRQAPVLRSAGTHSAMTQLLYESATLGATSVARALAARTPEQGVATLWATGDSPLRLTLNPLRGHPSQIVSLAVTADATRAFSVSSDGTTRVWRLASGRVIHEKQTTEQVVGLYATSDTPQVVAATSDGHAQVLDGDTGEPVGQVGSGKVATVTAFAVATGGTWGISGDVDGNATVWDITTGEPMVHLICGLDLITSVAVTPDGRRVAVASLSGDVVIWDLVLGLQLPAVRYPGTVNALALTTDGGRLLLGGDELVVHDLTDPAVPEIARLVPNDWVTALAVNPMMPAYALIGTAFGQVAYVRLPARTGRRDLWPTT